MQLSDFNPWWSTFKVPSLLLGKQRQHNLTAWEYLPVRQILMLVGLRRTGKTTLLYEIIHRYLQKEHPAEHLLYYSFDEDRFSLAGLLEEYQQIMNVDLEHQHIVICLDEIQKLDNWQNELKLYYDRYPSLKFIITGSAQIHLQQQGGDSLAGRFFKMFIKPLNFDEFLKIREVPIDFEQEVLHERELKKQFEVYLQTGGFLEAMELPSVLLRSYIRESLLDLVLYRDLRQVYKVAYPGLLMQLCKVLAHHPGIYGDYASLGAELGFDRKVIREYMGYLEFSLLVQKVYNYSGNYLKTEKKLKRFYLSNSAFSLALNPSISWPHLLEQYFVNTLEAGHFYRSAQKEEVDIILEKGHEVLPIEIKIRESIQLRDLKTMKRFLQQQQLSKGIVITKQTESCIDDKTYKIHLIPYWKHHTLQKLTGPS